MITEEQFAAIKRLIVSENCMIDRFEHYVSEITLPALLPNKCVPSAL